MGNKIYGLILAAGLSSRMDGFKPLVLFDQKPFIIHIIDKLSAVCDEIFVVTGFNRYALEDSVRALYRGDAILKKIDFIHNQYFEKGMFSSIQKGMKEILPEMSEQDYVMLHLIDQPHISEDVYEKLAEKAHNVNMKVIVPSYNMKAGHPIMLSKEVVEEIVEASESENLRDLLRKLNDEIMYVNISDESIIQDVNTPEEKNRYLK